MADCKIGGLKRKQHSKVVCQTAIRKAVKRYSRNSGHCFTNFKIDYNPFSPCCLLFYFYLQWPSSSFTLLDLVCFSTDAFCHQACLPSLCVPILLGVYFF